MTIHPWILTSVARPIAPVWTVEDQRRALAKIAEGLGLVTLSWQQADGHGLESITAVVQDPQTGEQGEIMMPSWLLRRLVGLSAAT
jgi:hypothetical protein